MPSPVTAISGQAPPCTPRRSSRGLQLLGAGWLFLVVAGFVAVGRYDLTPGTGAAVVVWPEESRLTHSRRRPTLLVFAHPQCPCTRATLAELTRLLSQLARPLDVTILFSAPSGAQEAWIDAPLVDTARSVVGVDVVIDVDGREAQRFGVTTSGQALLFASDGRVLFRGGITPSRGHEGESDGRAAIEALVRGQRATPAPDAPVFGCAIFDAPGDHPKDAVSP